MSGLPILNEFFNRLDEETAEITSGLRSLQQETVQAWPNQPENYRWVLIARLKMIEHDLEQINLQVDEVRAKLAEKACDSMELSPGQKKLVADHKHMNKVIDLLKPAMFMTDMCLQLSEE